MNASFAEASRKVEKFDVVDIIMCDSNDIYIENCNLHTSSILLKSDTPITFTMIEKYEISNVINNCQISTKSKNQLLSLLYKNEKEIQESYQKKMENIARQNAQRINQVDIAIKENDCTTLSTLLNEGMDIEYMINPNNETLIFLTVYHKSLNALQLFIQKGASLKQTNNRGMNVLYIATASNWLEGTKLLIESRCPVLPSKDNNTLLHVAVLTGNRSLVQYIVDRITRKIINIDRFAKNNDGFTPMDLTDDLEIKKIIKPKTHYGYTIQR